MNKNELVKIKNALDCISKNKPVKNITKGDKTLTILELIKNGIEGISLLTEAFLSAGYGASFYDIDRAFDKALSRRAGAETTKEDKQRFYNLIYKLKEDGLITKEGFKKISLTNKGKDLLKKLLFRSKRSLPSPKRYKKENINKIIVVTFDVPEKERRKRKWLTSVLTNLNFNLIQKSVWIGKTRLPEEFLSDLRNLKMLGYVEIFEITRSGSLKQIK